MTEGIDLDELETADEQADEDAPNRGDWFWSGADGEPSDD